MTRAQRLALAEKRLLNVLRNHTVATDRTLEQKISDAGPTNQRIEPFVLTQARRHLVQTGRIVEVHRGKTSWFHLQEATPEDVTARLTQLEPIYQATQAGELKVRIGQALEIAVYKSLTTNAQTFLGGFTDLTKHDDSKPYKRIEPPMMLSGKTIEKGPVDFILAQTSSAAGIEIKNYRTWLYPHSSEVRELLWKCADIEAVPVLIARRIPFVTFRLLNLSGGLVHQTYNQLYPSSEIRLASQVKGKTLLGYHDVRVGNEPDARLLKFVGKDLPELKEEAKALFLKFKDVHKAYGKGEITYNDWVREILVGAGIWGERREGDDSDYDEYM